ncbi:MAG: zinc ribbon domain-containing protein [Acidobacteriia bacterium]|nr:zinc ribbon domain-containing protein [Terriglobia bacterium]
MPIYEFECLKCGFQFERLRKLSDPPVSRCPQCGARRVSQLLSAPAIQFKGSGWYINDYGRGSVGEGSEKAKSNVKSKAGETKAGETRTGETKTGETKAGESSTTPSESKTSSSKDSKKSS